MIASYHKSGQMRPSQVQKSSPEVVGQYRLDLNLREQTKTRTSQLDPYRERRTFSVSLIVLLLFTLAASFKAQELRSAYATYGEIATAVSQDLSTARVDSDDHLSDRSSIENAEPRQYFKLHSVTSGNKKLSRRGYLTNNRKRQSNMAELLEGESGVISSNTKLAKPKISNATLKKLLNQSLLKAANGSASAIGKAGSNFKFVFIQRATAAPKVQSTNNSSKTEGGDSSPHTSSLAASVSRQLANSLLSSAAGLMGNLTSGASAPSISSLANSIVTIKSSNSDSGDDLQTSDSKLQSEDTIQKLTSKKPSTNSYSGSKKRKPSKIYNLPVKFVANGQPNNLVISTIKHHFATIKKLQAGGRLPLTSSSSAGSNTGSIISAVGAPLSGKNRKKPQTQKFNQKVGTNSRLIYLPIRYLANSKVNKIMISAGNKATHKSGN